MIVLYREIMPKKNNQLLKNEKIVFIQKLESIYSRYTLVIWLLIIFVPLCIITVGCLLLPELFYDQFVWRYFWGTIEADAQEETYGEVTEAYNPVNTIIYVIIVIIVLYWLYKLFKKLHINLDFKFFIAIIPFIVVGSVSRTLEDAELFYSPTVYLFIAPIIYIFIGVIVIGLILLGVGIKKYSEKYNMDQCLYLTATVFIILDIIYLIIYFAFHDQFSYILNPLIPVIISLSIIIILFKYFKNQKEFEMSPFVFSVGIWFLSISIIVLGQWQSISSWTDAYLLANPGNEIELQPEAFLIVVSLTVLGTFLVFITAKSLAPKYPKILPYMAGTNLTLFFGHFLDASATFVAIDYYGYAEKHVVPVFIIEVFHTAAVMYILKAIIIIFVVYFIDILYKKDFQANPILTGLVKIAILVLGLAPGIRDLLRLTIGV